METQVAYTTPMKPNVSHIRKEVRKAKPIPELWSATLWSQEANSQSACLQASWYAHEHL